MRNFRCQRVENFILHDECGRKRQVYEVNAEIAQLVEHNLAKVRVASSSLVFRSLKDSQMVVFFFCFCIFYSFLFDFLVISIDYCGFNKCIISKNICIFALYYNIRLFVLV